MTPINRIEFIQVLESVEPGLSTQATVEQSQAFCFKAGRVYTFDGEIFCKARTPLPDDLRGAVQGRPLLEALRALEADNIEVEIDDDEFVVKAKRDEVRVRTDPKVILPYQEVPLAKTWKRLPQPFSEAMEMVTECAGRDEEKFLLTCVHLTPKHIEAFDNFSFARWRMKTRLSEPCLVRAKAMKAIAKRGPTKVGEAPDWLCFRNGSGLSAAIRRFDPSDHGGDILERLNETARGRGKPVVFPKRLASAAKLADIFSSEYKDNNILKVYLRDGMVKIIGEGVSGHTLHRGKVNYTGPNMSFSIGPETLKNLIERHPEVEIGEGRIMVTGDKWYFATVAKELKKKEKE